MNEFNDPSGLEGLPEEIHKHARKLIADFAHDSPYKRAILVEALRLISDGYSNADIKMLAKTMGELRKGLDVFQPYQALRKVSVFGSARTTSDHPRYLQTKACAAVPQRGRVHDHHRRRRRHDASGQ